MNKIIRQKKFTKDLGLYKSNPDYERIKNVYLTNEKFSIASARVFLRMVKYNKDININKLSFIS